MTNFIKNEDLLRKFESSLLIGNALSDTNESATPSGFLRALEYGQLQNSSNNYYFTVFAARKFLSFSEIFPNNFIEFWQSDKWGRHITQG